MIDIKAVDSYVNEDTKDRAITVWSVRIKRSNKHIVLAIDGSNLFRNSERA
jgi:hypothetical protein